MYSEGKIIEIFCMTDYFCNFFDQMIEKDTSILSQSGKISALF